jgi:cholesterol oxidase
MSLEQHYDAAVVGSGFGGSVMAYRLADAGLRVCLFERGDAYPPGAFARRPREMRRNFWDPSEGCHGLFDVWSFRGLEAVVASGLGGGSLIYANVLLRMPERWFRRLDGENGYKPWPIDREALEPHYDAVESMLCAQRFPLGRPYHAPKSVALRDAAKARGLAWELPKLAVTFAADGSVAEPAQLLRTGPPNLYGAERYTCRLCGECDLGCNYGSKNSLDLTYLSAAAARGAEIRIRHEVRSFRPLDRGGYEIGYVEHDPFAAGRRTLTRRLRPRRVTARQLILAAGTLGTTYLLLQNHAHFPRIDRAVLGARFNGNGDLLAFATERDEGRHHRSLDPSYGPVITSAAVGEQDGRFMCIEDGGYPDGVSWMIQAASLLSRRKLGFAWRYLSGLLGSTSDSNLGAELSAVIGPGSLPLLGMGREMPNGRMYLRHGRLAVSWRMRRTKSFFRALNREMKGLTGHMDAHFVANPLSYLRRVVTVHPLGGCSMGRNPGEGVVDGNGEVFHYPGLYVVDGAAMPGPVGVNPALTIAAFADHSADHVIRTHPRPAS